jgi:hypothetical protein
MIGYEIFDPRDFFYFLNLNNKLLKKLKIFSNYFIFVFGSTRYSAMMRSSFRLEDIN